MPASILLLVKITKARQIRTEKKSTARSNRRVHKVEQLDKFGQENHCGIKHQPATPEPESKRMERMKEMKS